MFEAIESWLLSPVTADMLYAFEHSNLVSGKIFVGVLVLVSIYAWAVMVSKAQQLKRARYNDEYFLQRFRKEQNPLSLFLQRTPFEVCPLTEIYQRTCLAMGLELDARGGGEPDLLARGVAPDLKLNHYQITAIRNAAERTIADQALLLEDRMGFLATAANAAPLLGLLGTVWGVMDTFSSMAKSGAASIGEVAPGISGALITTAMSLVVAIPSAIGYNHLANNVRTIAVQMDNFADELIAAIQRNYLKEL